MQNTISNTTSKSSFSHFGKNKLLFANHSWYSSPKNKENWNFISNIHVKSVNCGGEVDWVPLYKIYFLDHTCFGGSNYNKGWKVWLGNERRTLGGEGSRGTGIWYDSFLKALSAARLHYLNLQLEEGEYKVLDESYMIFDVKISSHHYEHYCVKTQFEEIPENTKYPQLKKYKIKYEYDTLNQRPVYGNETALDNWEAPQIINALMDGDFAWALEHACYYNPFGTTREEAHLMALGYIYIKDPYYPEPYEPKYGYPIQMKAYDTIQKAIATAKRLYHVD